MIYTHAHTVCAVTERYYTSVYCVYVTHEQINNSEVDTEPSALQGNMAAVTQNACCVVTRKSNGNNCCARHVVINVWIRMLYG